MVELLDFVPHFQPFAYHEIPAKVDANPIPPPLRTLVTITPHNSETMTAPSAEQDRTEVTSTTFDIVEIDCEGDVVVKVGNATEGRLMRVSSKTLSLASDVFKAMFSLRYSEGQRTHSAENPLPLPEDDPQATEILFKLAHLKVHDPEEVHADCLPGLLMACDKYGCFNTFRYWLQPIKHRWYNAKVLTKNTQDLLQGIVVANIFDDGHQFSILVGRLYEQASEKDIRALIDSDLCKLMSTKFQNMFLFVSLRSI